MGFSIAIKVFHSYQNVMILLFVLVFDSNFILQYNVNKYVRTIYQNKRLTLIEWEITIHSMFERNNMDHYSRRNKSNTISDCSGIIIYHLYDLLCIISSLIYLL